MKNSKRKSGSRRPSQPGAEKTTRRDAAVRHDEGTDSDDAEGRPQGRKYWATSFFLIAVIAALANVAHIFADRHVQALVEAGAAPGMTRWAWFAIAVAGGSAIVAAFLLAVRWRRAVRLFASLEFASATTLLVMLATAAGTLILQKQPAEKFDAYYGGAAEVLRALHLEDLFHSWWFIALLGLVALSLAVDAGLRVRDIVAGKRDAWKSGGFVLTHGGIVIVLAGGLVSMLYGDKGMVDLTKGMTSSRYVRYADMVGPGEERVGDLGFGIRLDDFEIEYYDPAYSVYVFREAGLGDDGRPDFEAVGAIDPTTDEAFPFRRDGDSGRYRLSVKSFDLPKAIAEGGTPHELVVDGERRVPVKLGDTVTVEGGVRLRIDKYLPHFNFDIQRKMAVSASSRPDNPALEVTVLREGEKPSRTWLFANNPGFSMGGHGGKGDPLAQRVVYRLRRPEVALELTKDGRVLTPAKGAPMALGASMPLFPPGSDDQLFVSFHEKGDRIKQYHSTVSVIDDGEVVVEKAPLSVNHPITYGGYYLYQSNYRAWDLNYSGIQVVRDPGLAVVYAGMILMMIGVFYVLYFRRRGRKAAAASGERDDRDAPGADATASADDRDGADKAAAAGGA